MVPANHRSEKAYRRHAEEVAALLRAVLESPAVTDPATRAAAYQSDEELSPPLRQYVAKVRGESYRITDDDVQRLLTAGYSQDAVFEITVATALGAAMQRLETGLRVLREVR
jgi:alkylhydroperoxidase family enzyme